MTKGTEAYSQFMERSAVRADARWWPRNPYVQALVMYPRRWVFRVILIWGALLAALAGFVIFQNGSYYWENRESGRPAMERSLARFNEQAPAMMAAVGAALALFLLPGVVAVATHVRDRVTGWRGTVIPRYRTPHVVGGALLVACTVAYVACMFWVIQPFSLVGLLAAAMCIAAVASWCAALPPKGVAVVGLSAVAVVSLPQVRAWMAYAVWGFDETRAALILLAATAAQGGVWAWLALTRWERTPARPEDLMLAEGFVRWRRRAGEDVTVMGLRRRTRLWRLGSATGLMPQACAGGLLTLILLILLVLPEADRRRSSVPVALPLAAMSMMVPVGAVVTQWARRLPGLGYEMSRPVTRRTFVRDAGLAMAADWGTWWGWMTLGGTVGLGVAAWFMRNGDVRWSSSPWAIFGAVVAYSAAVQVAMYGVSVWVMRFQAVWALYLTALAGMLLCWIPFLYLLSHCQNQNLILGLTTELVGACVFAGLLLAVDARRRWLRMDLL